MSAQDRNLKPTSQFYATNKSESKLTTSHGHSSMMMNSAGGFPG